MKFIISYLILFLLFIAAVGAERVDNHERTPQSRSEFFTVQQDGTDTVLTRATWLGCAEQPCAVQ